MLDIGAIFDKVWDIYKAVKNNAIIVSEPECVKVLRNCDIIVSTLVDYIHYFLFDLGLMVEDLRWCEAVHFLGG